MEERDRRKSGNKKILWAVLAMAGVVGGGALVSASVPHSFTTGETLTADGLNGNFAALDQRLAAVEALAQPPGAIIAYGGPAGSASDGGAPALPPGWLLCDGSGGGRPPRA